MVFVAPVGAIRVWKRVFSFFLSHKPNDLPIKFSQTPMAPKSKWPRKFSGPFGKWPQNFRGQSKWPRKFSGPTEMAPKVFGANRNGPESFRGHFPSLGFRVFSLFLLQGFFASRVLMSWRTAPNFRFILIPRTHRVFAIRARTPHSPARARTNDLQRNANGATSLAIRGRCFSAPPWCPRDPCRRARAGIPSPARRSPFSLEIRRARSSTGVRGTPHVAAF